MDFFLNSAHKFRIGEDEETTFPLGAGLTSVEPAGNEELSQDRYLDGEGAAETDVTGGQQTLAYSGHRKYGDDAQDFIYDKKLKYGSERRCYFEWEDPTGKILKGSATIANIEGPGGEAGAKGEISFEIHFNGTPEQTEAAAS
ncbi:phage tail tube protein [Salipaludibacillus aurantiacus]|uniref:Phage major tail protein, TP901-1 family n=1 Tax=Salipaludibacillus aurantiacus TaxID=1601833 RepID=A0A1H9U0E0_9BACI|nr:capsid protein [Salipaludibacillus aurantiacus]SES02644.1 hypothetical protein SAMN05518684_106198 [Salipaludibacillus aurantiacus]